jgi:hypothetical protein
MNKRIGITLLIALTFAALALATYYVRHHDALPTATVAQAQRANTSRPACRPDNSSHLHLLSRDSNDIGIAGTSYITDVPAGTNAAVRVATYDGKTMTGATLYPSPYGSYNFEAKKVNTTSTNEISWQVTGFTPCKP